MPCETLSLTYLNMATPVQQNQTAPCPSSVPALVAAANTAMAQTRQPQLSFTNEQLMEAQAMFRTANCVTKLEKAYILGFIAGLRVNLCPNQSNIVGIKLSENIENVFQSDDTYLTMLAETYFQINYNNGQWTRVMEYKHIDGMVPQKIPPGTTVITNNNQYPVVSIASQNVNRASEISAAFNVGTEHNIGYYDNTTGVRVFYF